MANAAERGGGTRTSPADALAKQRAMERQSFTYTPPRPKKTTPKSVVTRKRRAADSGGSQRRSSSVERRISRSGSSNRRSSSSGNRTRRSAPSSPPKGDSKVIKPIAPPKPVVPSAANFLRSDTTYQRQLAAYAKALSDFQADQGLARGDYEQGYQSTFRDIGLAKQTASDDLENDYASRGLLKSSLYNTALGDLNTQYQNQYNDLSKQRTSFLDQLGQEFSKYKNEQGTQQQNAMQEAMRRRAEKYNL